jgi:hypothetical protein
MAAKVTIPALLQMKRFANLNHVRKPSNYRYFRNHASPSA